MNKNILIIGGAGYIGTIITRYFLKKNFKVTNLDNLIYNHTETLNEFKDHKNFNFVFGDLRNEQMIEDLSSNCDIVIVLGGLVGDPITKKYPLISDEINNKGLKKTIDICKNKKIENFIFVSTCSNYGLSTVDLPLDENAELKPLSLYAKHKVSIEKYILDLKGKAVFSPTILRFSTAFGLSPRMRFDLTINQFTKSIFMKENLDVFDANTWRPYCHVFDFGVALEKIIEADKKLTNYEVFNVGGDNNNYTKKQIVDKILEYLPSGKVSFTNKSQDPRNYKVNFSKIENLLNFKISYSVNDGIEEIIEFLKKKNNYFSDIDKSQLGNYVIEGKQ